MIELDSITKIYQMGDIEMRAPDDVSLSTSGSELVAIMDPSDSGKSTMMNILGCLDGSTEGHYGPDGVDVGRLRDSQLTEILNREIGFVFQSLNLNPRASAAHNVELPLVYAGLRDRRKRASAALKRVGLDNRQNHQPTELSGRQQQRVAIARALVTNPTMLLADEPTGNQDTTSSVEITKLLIDLNDAGRTVVLTHDEEIAGFAKRVVRLRDGQIVSDKVQHDRSVIGL